LEVTQATMTNKYKYRKEHLTLFYLNCVNKEKCRKCESNTFTLPRKPEYCLLLVLACSRNC